MNNRILLSRRFCFRYSSDVRRTLLLATAIVLVAAGIWLLFPSIEHKLAMAILESRVAKIGNTAPDFALKNAKGDTLRLSQLKGKVVLLNFWATWCGPCKIETPWFVEFQNKWQGRGFTVLGVSMDDDGWPVITPWLREHNVNYPVVLTDTDTPQLYGGVEALPTTFVIGRDGKIAAIHTGLISKTQYETEIAGLLRK